MKQLVLSSLLLTLPMLSMGITSCSEDFETPGMLVTPGTGLGEDKPDKPDIPDLPDDPTDPTSPNVVVCDFDRDDNIKFTPVNCLLDEGVSNPSGTGLCGKITHNKAGAGDCVAVFLDRPMDFTRNAPVIKFKVYGPKSGAITRVKLASTVKNAPKLSPDAVEVKTTKSGEWEEIGFDFSAIAPQSNWYDKLYIFFNYTKEAKTKDEEWFFDDLSIPDADLAPICLFKRVDGQPPRPDKAIPWMSHSTASPQILTPEESIDGNWWLYVRGSAGSNSSAGVFTQDAKTFNPLGPWKNHYMGDKGAINPGMMGEADGTAIMAPRGVKGDDGYYVFYKGYSLSGGSKEPSIIVAASTDGITYANPVIWKKNAAISDVVFHEGKYYVFNSRTVLVGDSPHTGENAEETKDILNLGDGPANFDRASINGQMLFRLKVGGSDKWFMVYQGSASLADFPERLHVAYSDDLLTWTKVRNDRPLFSRGNAGWIDQGAIWSPAVFEHDGMLYMYYEGWGREGYVADRNKSYFTPAHSEIGIAMCRKSDFIKWCGL